MAAKEKEKKFSYKDTLRRLKIQGPERLYLFYGEEEYLRDAFLEEIRKTCLGGGPKEFNWKRLDETAEPADLEEAVNAPPFISERTLVEVRGFDFSSYREKKADRLKKILESIPTSCTVVLIMPAGAAPDNRLALTKAIRKIGLAIDFTAQEAPDLVNWIGRRFQAENKEISREDAEYLIFCAGGLMNRLLPEIEKLSFGVAGKRITRQDIDAMVDRLPEAEVFEMTDRLGEGRFDDAARQLGQLLSRREEPIKLLALIGMQMRRIYTVKLAEQNRLNSRDTSKLTGIRYDFILSRLRTSARRFSMEALSDILEDCAEYDYMMKSTGLDSAALLRQFFAEMAARTRQV